MSYNPFQPISTPQSSNESSGSAWVSVYSDEANHWTVSGLDEKSVHQFRVRARNDFGWSGFSNASLPFKTEQLVAVKEKSGALLSLISNSCSRLFSISFHKG